MPSKILMTRNSNLTKARHLISGLDPTQTTNSLADQVEDFNNHEPVAVVSEGLLEETVSEMIIGLVGGLGPLLGIIEVDVTRRIITVDLTAEDQDHTAGENFVLVYSVLTKNIGSYFQFFKDKFQISMLSSRDIEYRRFFHKFWTRIRNVSWNIRYLE